MRMICAFVCMLALSACAAMGPATAPQEVSGLTFDNMQAVPLNVAKIEVFDAFNAPVTEGHVEHLFPVSPAAAARKMAEQKLSAEGSDNLLRVVIEDASVMERKLPVGRDFWSNFNREPSERYDARVSLRFELVNEQAPDIVIGHASVIAERTKTVLEGTSPAARDRAWNEMTDALMGDLYNGFDGVVRNTFARQ